MTYKKFWVCGCVHASEKFWRDSKRNYFFFKVKTENLINLTRAYKIYRKKHKTLLKDHKSSLSKWKDRPQSWLRLNIIKMSVLSKLINKLNIISIETPSICCCLKLDKLIIKFIRQNKQAKAARKTLKKSNMNKLALPDVKKNYKASKIHMVS